MVFSQFKKTVLDNGLTVITEHIPSVRSVSLGVWIKTGTRFENKRNNGSAHFLEHMMFKGTKKRTPKAIARSLESVGGHLNAFTSKEYTCYYAEVLDEHVRKSINLFSDMLCNSTFPLKELEKERSVILDEIQSLEDTPDDLIQDIFIEKLFMDHPLGFSILGTENSLQKISRESLIDFYERNYLSKEIIIAAAGNLDHEKLVEMCIKSFHFLGRNHNGHIKPPKQIGAGEYTQKKAVSQVHICVGVPSFPYRHPDRYAMLVLNTLMGGGMSSRLFQNIRERYGVAYSIYSFLDFYFDSGVFGVYLGTDKKNLNRALKLLGGEFQRIRKNPIPEREFKEAKAQLKGNLMLSMESTANRMARLAKMEIYNGSFQEIDEIIEQINRVDRDRLWEISKEVFREEKFLRVIFEPMKN
jgi:predicted Zn-dependent peptidase